MIYLPQHFNLFNQRWQIRLAQPFELQDDLGQCRPDNFEILINPNQSMESMIHTILHETIHSVEMKLHLELTERQVDLVALGLINLFRNNPDMVELLIPQNKELE